MNKPEQILDLEKHLGFELTEVESWENIINTKGSKEGKTFLLEEYYDNPTILGLNLQGCKLNDISFLKNFPDLEYINLEFNQITDISCISDLREVDSLRLSHNQIIDIYALKDWNRLTFLDLSNNPIENISPLQYTTNLYHLILVGTYIRDISVLKNLPYLSNLYLGYSSWIDDISELINFKHLTHLNVANVIDISQLRILKKLTFLTHLTLWNSGVSNILMFRNLTNLVHLDLSSSEKIIEDARTDFKKYFPKLEYLKIDKARNIPKEIIGQDNCLYDLRDYYYEFKKGKIINERAKLIIVGNGRVGKTSLLRKLQGLSYNPDEKYTHGIQIGHLEKEHLPEVKTEKLNASVWDFGGQEIFYATHQFFMTDDAVYILAWTKEENIIPHRERDKETLPTDEKWQSVEYWLDTIRRHAPKSPIMVIQTHTDFGKEIINQQNFKEEFNASNFFDFSALKDFGLAEIQDSLSKNLNSLHILGNEFPKSYDEVIDIIENFKKADKNIISYGEFVYKICQGIISKGGENSLLNYLHKTGLVVHYAQNPKLKDFVYINPDWLTKQVYSLINNNLHQTKGKITKNYLETHLPNYEKLGLLELFKQFDLIFEAQDENEIFWISPQYLPKDLANDKSFKKQKNKSELVLTFRFSRFMPDNVMINFLSRYGSFAEDIYWKNGIYFTKNNTDCIVLKENEKDLQIWIDKNQENRTLLKELVEVFSDFGKNAKTEISFDNHDFVDYEKLKTKIQEPKTTEIETVNGETVDLELFRFLFENVKKESTKVAQNQLDRMETKLDKVDKTQDEHFEVSKSHSQKLDLYNSKVEKGLEDINKSSQKILKEVGSLRDDFVGFTKLFEKFKKEQKEVLEEILDKFTNDNAKLLGKSYEKIIENLGDDWTKLDEKTLVFLASGELLFDNLGDKQEDYSPVVMQFGRAIENELAVKLFKPFKQDLDTKLLEDADYQLRVLKSRVQKNKKNEFSKEQKDSVTKLYKESKPQSLISMLNYFFSLGNMINALEVQTESIFVRIRLFKDFDNFIDNRIKNKNLILEKSFLDTLRGIAATRNKAGHTEVIEYKNSINVKKQVNKIIKIWISSF